MNSLLIKNKIDRVYLSMGKTVVIYFSLVCVQDLEKVKILNAGNKISKAGNHFPLWKLKQL